MVNWAVDIAPVMYRACMGCHVGESVLDMDGIGHFPLKTYEEAAAVGIYLQEVAVSRRMPPWPGRAEDGCGPDEGWKDDPTLTTDEIRSILEWADGEMAQGDLALAPDPPQTPDPALSGATQELFGDEPVAPPPSVDTYTCLLLDPGLEETSWLTGVQALPDNRTILGTVATYLVDPEQVPVFEDKAGADGAYDCFALPTDEGARLVGIWSPGSPAFEPPEGSGFEAAVGTRVLVRIHYHVWTDEAVGADSTGVALRWSAENPGAKATMVPVGNFDAEPGLVRQAGETQASFEVGLQPMHVEEMLATPTEAQANQAIWALAGWMHFAGAEMDVVLEGSGGEQACMLGIRQWDPDWLRGYRFNGPISDLPVWESGAQLRVACTYDNTDFNENLSERLEDEGLAGPVPMALGDGPLDENCLVFVGLVER